MATYSKRRKAEVLRRMEEPERLSISEVSKEEGIPKSTISGWIKSKNGSKSKKSSRKEGDEWTSEEKFHIVMESFSLNEAELQKYACEKGIYVGDIKQWRNNCFSANEESKKSMKENKALLDDVLNREKELIRTNKKQEKELIRKEKALAEAAALLILSKKAKAIWGDPEDA